MPENFELMNALMQKLARIVMGPDTVNGLQIPQGFYISMCAPGIAVDAPDFDFGFVAPGANSTSAAADFSSLANSVPPTQGRWMPSDIKVYDVYGSILRDSILPTVSLSGTEKKQLDAARNLLIRDVHPVLRFGVLNERTDSFLCY